MLFLFLLIILFGVYWLYTEEYSPEKEIVMKKIKPPKKIPHIPVEKPVYDKNIRIRHQYKKKNSSLPFLNNIKRLAKVSTDLDQFQDNKKAIQQYRKEKKKIVSQIRQKRMPKDYNNIIIEDNNIVENDENLMSFRYEFEY